MALFTIADLHLSFGTGKPMDLFGDHWENHPQKIKENWEAKISAQDTVILPGDLSWGMTFEESAEDFAYLDALPGKKIILKGNHDYWWSTVSKMKQFFEMHHFSTIDILFNNAFLAEGVAIAGTRGWMVDDEQPKEQNDKIFQRECGRLETSLKEAKKLGDVPILAFFHYPPVLKNSAYEPFLDLLEQYGAEQCYYGHIHGKAAHVAFQGKLRKIGFHLVACDYLSFSPKEIIQKEI